MLFTSHYFMASDYIRDHEVPQFLQACEEGKLALACLHLRPSVDLPFTVSMDDGAPRQIKLSEYQSLNDPGTPLESQLEPGQNALFNEAVLKIHELYERYVQKETPGRPASGQRHELTIRLELSGNHLFRTFYSQQSRLATGYSAWPPAWEPGAALYQILFGADKNDQTGEVLQPLFPKAAKPTPIFSPVRVRIQTTESLLAELPWTQTIWDGKRLWDYGWTFELLGAATDDDLAALPNLRLQAPCPVLLIAPGAADGGESHLLALENRLDHAWPAYREHPPHVGTRAQLMEALQKFRPCIVYYYGPADGDGKTLRLRLDDGPLDITELPQLWQRPPRIVFLNLLEASPIGLGNVLAPVHAYVPLVVAQTWSHADCDKPRQSAKKWFLELLQSEDRDPIELLHKHGLYTVQIWGRYGQWRYSPQVVSPREKLARLLLDRENQRRAVQGVVSALVHDSGRRLSCLLAYGDESDLVYLFVEQLLEYLRLHSKREAHILPVRLNLPPAETFTVDQVQERVRSFFSSETLRKGLEKYKRPTPERTRLVLLLDWGVRGTADTPAIDNAALQAWVEFCANRLCEQCPSDMRLLSVLALQRSRQQHDDIAAFVEQLSADPQLTKHAFTMEELHPLGNVRIADLNKFLKDEHTSCPQERISDMSKLIWQETKGQFNKTVDLIEEAENVGVRGWLELYERLKG